MLLCFNNSSFLIADSIQSHEHTTIYYQIYSDSVVMNLPANAGDSGLIPGSGRSPAEGNGYTLQYSCLENSMDRGAWQSTVTERLSTVQQHHDLLIHFTNGAQVGYFQFRVIISEDACFTAS